MTNPHHAATRLLHTVTLTILPALALAGGCKSADSCSAVVTKAVETMVAEQGSNSMLKAEYIPKLTEGCEASKAIEAHPETAKCVMSAADFTAMKACDGLDPMMKAWMKGK